MTNPTDQKRLPRAPIRGQLGDMTTDTNESNWNGNVYRVHIDSTIEANSADEAQVIAGRLLAGMDRDRTPCPLHGPGSWAPDVKDVTFLGSDPHYRAPWLINNGYGELLPVNQCDYGTGTCSNSVAWIIAQRATGYLDAAASPATAERRPLCERHAAMVYAQADRFRVDA